MAAKTTREQNRRHHCQHEVARKPFDTAPGQQRAGNHCQQEAWPPDARVVPGREHLAQRRTEGAPDRKTAGRGGLGDRGVQRARDQRDCADYGQARCTPNRECSGWPIAHREKRAQDDLPRQQRPEHQAGRKVQPPASDRCLGRKLGLRGLWLGLTSCACRYAEGQRVCAGLRVAIVRRDCSPGDGVHPVGQAWRQRHQDC